MPIIRVNGAGLYYEEHGTGPETIVFAHGLLWSCRMFDDQVAAFKDRYRCIAFDFRGQGQSEVTRDGYDMETLYEDAAALIEALDCAPCHFIGLSMGGFIAMRLAARRPDLVKSLVLLETSPDPEPAENMPKYRQLAFIARWLGIGLVADRVMPIMFGQKFLNDPARAVQRSEWRQRMSKNHRVGVTRATMGVITRRGIYDEIAKIHRPGQSRTRPRAHPGFAPGNHPRRGPHLDCRGTGSRQRRHQRISHRLVTRSIGSEHLSYHEFFARDIQRRRPSLPRMCAEGRFDLIRTGRARVGRRKTLRGLFNITLIAPPALPASPLAYSSSLQPQSHPLLAIPPQPPGQRSRL